MNLMIMLCLVMLSSCSISGSLVPVTYDKSIKVTSSKTATVELISGITGGSSGTTLMPVGMSIYVPVSAGPYPKFQFHKEDQKIFISSLVSELNRLGLLKVIEPNGSTGEPDVKILVFFSQTHHFPDTQEYTLDVAMEMRRGESSFGNSYHILSSEGDSYWQKMNTTATEGKAKAAKKLMNAMISDIEKWVAAN